MMEDENTDLSGLLVLLVEDDEIMRLSLEDRLRIEGVPVVAVGDLAAADRRLAKGDIDLIVTDIRLPDGSGADLFDRVSRHHPGLPVILMTGFGSVPQAVELVKAGAADYLTKPFDMQDFMARVRRNLARAAAGRLAGEMVAPDGRRLGVIGGILGQSPAMRRIERLIQRVGQVDSPVLITGETGTGKEAVANLIHQNGIRAGRPLVRVNCAALPADRIDAELSLRIKETADGTLLLDEIAEIPPESQVRLLEILDDCTKSGPAPRLISITDADPEAAITAGDLRSDLYWRLNVIHIHIPALRERPEDIIHLARRFAAEQAVKMRRTIVGLSPEVEARLLERDYPGNVRELWNTIERAMALCDGTRIEMHDLLSFDQEPPPETDQPLRQAVADAEIRAIRSALARHGGAVARTAQSLGVSRKNLWEKMKRYGIEG